MPKGIGKLICALFACLALASCGGDSVKNNDTPPPANALSDIPALIDYYKVPGVSIALIKDFQIERLLVYGVRNRTSGELVTVETLFQAGSLSKSVAAVAALRLAQDGRLLLDEDINNTLTSWKLPDNSYTAIQKATPRMLLNHTAGTTVHGFDGYPNTDPLPSLIQVLNGAPPANSPPVIVEKTPGQSYNYSGGGYAVMQQALIDVTGKPFADMLKETVLDPLAMTDSTYLQPLPAEKSSLASAGHDSNGSVIEGASHVYPELAAAGLWTTPKDLALFLIELQQSLQGKSNRVLNTAMTKEMMTPPPVNSTYGLGIGLHTAGAEQYFMHSGVNAGFQLFMVAHKDKGLGAVVMTNGDNGGLLIPRIMTIITSIESWPTY